MSNWSVLNQSAVPQQYVDTEPQSNFSNPANPSTIIYVDNRTGEVDDDGVVANWEPIGDKES